MGRIAQRRRILYSKNNFVCLYSFYGCLNMWLQYRRVGKWADYLHGERVYIILSFVAKSVLAWQIFANTLIE